MNDSVSWHFGTMGFSWKDWVGPFYPPDLASREFLAYYSRIFDTVEIDSTFYGTPRPEVIDRWDAITPPGFKICLKMPREITHEKGLVGAEQELDKFIKTVRSLGDKLGVILLQFPPSFDITSYGALHAFLGVLPEDLRFAVEIRHASWYDERVESMLAGHHVAWASTEYESLPKRIYRTTDFLYFRLIGHHGSFESHESEKIDVGEQLKWWWENLQPHLSSVDSVYGFFNNDYSGFAAGTLNRFKSMFGFEVKPFQFPGQPKLF